MRNETGDDKRTQVDYSNPYKVMWQELEGRIDLGKTAWGKLELQAILREIEVAVWRRADYIKGKEEEASG